jgi:arginine decarboxylase
MTSSTESLPLPELKKVFAVASARIDQWSQLNALARSWATVAPTGAQAGTRHADIVKLLGSITRIEYCWAYPGPRLLAAIGEALERRDPAGFARLVQKVSRALLTSDFRRDSLAWDVSGEAASPGLNTLPPDLDATAAHKPYFEVLIVTPTDAATWERARDDLRRMRRPEDPFNYEIVQVGSFEDAALAVMVNDTLQAVVIIDATSRSTRVRSRRENWPPGSPRRLRAIGQSSTCTCCPIVRSRALREARRRRQCAACSITSRSRWRCTYPSSTE